MVYIGEATRRVDVSIEHVNHGLPGPLFKNRRVDNASNIWVLDPGFDELDTHGVDGHNGVQSSATFRTISSWSLF
jgi:hypothetical protein